MNPDYLSAVLALLVATLAPSCVADASRPSADTADQWTTSAPDSREPDDTTVTGDDVGSDLTHDSGEADQVDADARDAPRSPRRAITGFHPTQGDLVGQRFAVQGTLSWTDRAKSAVGSRYRVAGYTLKKGD